MIPPVAELREQAVQDRLKAGGYLSENAWIHRVLDQVEQNLQLVEEWGIFSRRMRRAGRCGRICMAPNT